MNGTMIDLELTDDVRIQVPHRRAEEYEYGDHDDHHQRQDQGIFYQALAFFPLKKQHMPSPPLHAPAKAPPLL
jgi:hypothetical protein